MRQEFRRAGQEARHRARERSRCAPASIRSGTWRRPAQVRPWKELAPTFAALVQRARRPRLSRAVRGRGRARHPQCRRLGSAGACVRARLRRHLSARARSRRHRARCGAPHDLFPPCQRMPTSFSPSRNSARSGELWARVEQACGLAPAPAYVSAETAWRMMTRRDPYVNILRSTIAVFAAGLGGADAITVLPFTAAHRTAGPFRAPRRAQHAAHSAGRIESREGRPTPRPARAGSRI